MKCITINKKKRNYGDFIYASDMLTMLTDITYHLIRESYVRYLPFKMPFAVYMLGQCVSCGTIDENAFFSVIIEILKKINKKKENEW